MLSSKEIRNKEIDFEQLAKDNLSEINLYEIRNRSLEGIEKLTNLRDLKIDNCPEIKDLSPLTKLTNLRQLYLRDLELENHSSLEPLSKLKNLECLTLNDLGPDCISLKSLNSIVSENLILCIYSCDYEFSGEIYLNFYKLAYTNLSDCKTRIGPNKYRPFIFHNYLRRLKIARKKITILLIKYRILHYWHRFLFEDKNKDGIIRYCFL